MANSEKSGGKELHLLKSILNSSSQCSLGEDQNPKQTTGDKSSDDDINQKTDDDADGSPRGGGEAGGQGVARPKTSYGGRMSQPWRRNVTTKSHRCGSIDDAGSDAAHRRLQMYRRVCVDEGRVESTNPRKSSKSLPLKSRGRSAPARRAEYVAMHTNSLEQKYQELRDLLENQFLKEREELNRSLLKQTRQVMHKYRLAQSGYVGTRPSTAPTNRRRRPRAMKESDTQCTQTDESANFRNADDDIRLGEAKSHGDTFILIDATKDNGVSVTKHVTFLGANEGRMYSATTEGDVVNTDRQLAPQNVRRSGRLRRGREKTRANGTARHGRQQKTEGDSPMDNVQRRRHSDDASARDSDSSSGSSADRSRRRSSYVSNSPSTTASTSPSRGSSSVGPLCDHHLKYSSNAKLIEWLRQKNRVYRQQMAAERKSARKKRREEEAELREKEIKKEEAQHAMALWLKKKKSEERLLRRRQRTEDAFNLQQQLNSNVDNEVTLGTTVYLRSRVSRDGSSSARGKLYASSVSNINTKTVKPKHARNVRNNSTNNNSCVDDTNVDTTMPSAGNDHECMCGFNGDPSVAPFIPSGGTQEPTERPDSVNKRQPSQPTTTTHRSIQATSLKGRRGSCAKGLERRKSSESKRRSITSNEKLHNARSEEKYKEAKLTENADHGDTGVIRAKSVTDEANTGRKTSVNRPDGSVGKGRRKRLRATHEMVNKNVNSENVINIKTAGVDDDAEHGQCETSVGLSSHSSIDAAGEMDHETPQNKELRRAPRRPSSARPRSSRRCRRLSFGAPSPPKPSASPTVGQLNSDRPTNERARGTSARPTPTTSSLCTQQANCQKRPTTPKPELPCTRPAYEKVQYQQKSWDSFSEHVWKQVNDESSDHGSDERPEPQGSDKPDDDPSTVSESRDVTSADRDTTSSVGSPADADTSGKDKHGSDKSNDDTNGDKKRNGSTSRAKVVSGGLTDENDDSAWSGMTAGVSGATNEDVPTLSSDTDRTSSDESVREDVEVETDYNSSTQAQPHTQETRGENDTGSDMTVKGDTEVTEATTKTDSRGSGEVDGKRDENHNTDKYVTFLTNAEDA